MEQALLKLRKPMPEGLHSAHVLMRLDDMQKGHGLTCYISELLAETVSM